jgi:hypothetical protein
MFDPESAIEALSGGIFISVDLESQRVLSYHFMTRSSDLSDPFPSFQKARLARQKYLFGTQPDPLPEAEDIPF